MAVGNEPERATFRDVFAVGEFRALWLAQILSVMGDQLARVALSILVFDRTGSTLLTAATYAVTYLPWVIGALTLSGLGDRFPRRRVMVLSDLGRAALVGLMALPGMPLWALIMLLFVVTLLDTPFDAARAAIFPDILVGDQYVLGTAVFRITNQTGLVVGFATGGVIVALIGPLAALVANAGTFALSTLLILLWVRHRPTPRAPTTRPSALAEACAGVRLVFGDPTLRTLTLLAWLAAFYVVPEGLAIPYAAQLGGGPIVAGLVLAAMPLGGAIGAVLYGRLVPREQRLRWMGPLAMCTCAPLTLIAIKPGLAASLTLLAVAGSLSAYQLAANAAFVEAVPDAQRSQAFGLVQAGFSVTQGGSIVLAGWAAEAVGPATVIGTSGGLGVAAATALAGSQRRAPTQATT